MRWLSQFLALCCAIVWVKSEYFVVVDKMVKKLVYFSKRVDMLLVEVILATILQLMLFCLKLVYLL